MFWVVAGQLMGCFWVVAKMLLGSW